MAKARRQRRRPLLALAGLVASTGGLAARPATTYAQRAPEATPVRSQRVLIRLPERPDALLDEALVRVRGELSAMGLTPDEQAGGSDPEQAPVALEAGVAGALLLARDGSVIRIRAFGPASSPVTQELDARASDVTPEVVAVRAVEALRAVMLPLPAQSAAPPKPKPPEPPPARQAPAEKPLPSPALAKTSLTPRGPGALSLWLGPLAEFDVSSSSFGAGAGAGALYGRFPSFGGAFGRTTLFAHELEDASGRVSVRRSSVALRGGCTLRLLSRLEAWATLDAGGALYGIQGHANPGYASRSRHHLSPLVGVGVGLTFFVSRVSGVYAEVDASVASNAPDVLANQRALGSVERPLLSASAGVLLLASPIF